MSHSGVPVPGLLVVLVAVLLWVLPAGNAYCLAEDAAAGPVAHLPAQPRGFDLTPYLQYWHDPNGATGFADVRQLLQRNRFKPLPSATPNLGFRAGTVWLHFQLLNPEKRSRSLLLELDFAVLDTVDLYCYGADQEPIFIPAGDHVQYASRPLKVRNFVFPLTLAAGQQLDCLFKVESSSTLVMPIKVYDQISYIEASQLNERLLGMMYGVALALMLYNLVQFVLTRVRLYLYFSLHVLGGVIYMTFMDGTLAELWIRLEVQDLGLPLAVALGGASAILFSCEFLELKASHPLLQRVAAALVALTLVLASLALLGSSRLAYMAITGYMLVLCCFLMLVGIRRLLDGFMPARSYLLGFGVVYLMVIWIVLNVFFLRSDVRLITYGMNMVWMFELMLLSIVISTRMRTLELRQSNISEQMRNLQHENQSRTDLFARVSHEIRTPMNGMLGLVELVQSTPLSKEQKRYINAIQSAGRGLLDVINDVLDFSRMEAGKMVLNNERFILRELLADACAIYEFEARRKGIELGCIIAPGTPLELTGDRVRIRQILLNTLSNALKHTECGYVHINVHITDQIHEDKLVIRFEVEDSGRGIAAEDQQQLFKSYSQIKHKHGGSASRDSTGLGLVICQQLVRLMGGDMGVKSELGAGSCFWFEIPLAVADDTAIAERPIMLDQLSDALPPDPIPQPAPTPLKSPALVTSAAAPRVLLVEDNEINQSVMLGFLAKMNIVPDLADNGRTAVEMVQQAAAYDLILMDCEMPVMDGYEAASRILRWQRSNALPLVPIVALSAHTMGRHREMAMAAGMVGYLSKPISYQLLYEKVTQYIDVPAS